MSPCRMVGPSSISETRATVSLRHERPGRRNGRDGRDFAAESFRHTGGRGASSPAGTQRGPLGIGAEEAELLAAGRLEDEPERGWVRVAAGLRAAGLDAADAILPAAVDDDAPAGGDDVAVPVHVLAVGELGDEPLEIGRASC